MYCGWFFFFSSRRRHTRWTGDWSSDVCSSDLCRGAHITVDSEIRDRAARQTLATSSSAKLKQRHCDDERVSHKTSDKFHGPLSIGCITKNNTAFSFVGVRKSLRGLEQTRELRRRVVLGELSQSSASGTHTHRWRNKCRSRFSGRALPTSVNS